ncbi:MAG: glycosyltransferase, partial [Arenibacter sp.]
FGILDKIKHIPFTKDVSKYLQESDVFLQGSYVEGFPNALLESCAVGTPVIAFKAPGGIDEIIEEDVNGYIAKDEADFLIKLNLIGEKHWDPAVVRDSVYKKYSKDIIIKKYQDLFIDLNKD